MRDRRFREGVFLAIGVTTPLGILAVNGSAYVMQHYGQFRLILAVCALVSSLFLQGLAAYSLLMHLSRRVPGIYAEYRRWAIAISVLVVIGWSGFGAYETYLSMSNPSQLPNRAAVLISVGLLLLPIVTVVGARLLDKRRDPERRRTPSAPRAR